MKGPTLATVGVLLIAVAVPSHAQGPILFWGGGVTIPISDYKNVDGAKTGWMVTGGFGIPVGGKGLMVGAEGYFGSNKHEEPPAGDKTNLYGAGGFLMYRFGPTTKAGLYLIGSAGAMKHDYRSTAFPTLQGGEWEFAWSGGAGVDIPIGATASIWIESRYFSRGDTRFIPIFAGVSIGLGGGS